jgi:hypothetical protein
MDSCPIAYPPWGIERLLSRLSDSVPTLLFNWNYVYQVNTHTLDNPQKRDIIIYNTSFSIVFDSYLKFTLQQAMVEE